jgi:hypothetical protein
MGADKNTSRRSISAYAPNSQPRILTRLCQGHVVTTDRPTLGKNPKQSRSGSTTQEAKDLVVLQITRRTVRKDGADGPHALGGQSATVGRTVLKRQQNLQYHTLNNRWSAPCPRTVRERLVPRGQSAVSVRHGYPWSPPTRLMAVPDKWVRPTRRPADLPLGPTDLVGGPYDLLKTFQKNPQTT